MNTKPPDGLDNYLRKRDTVYELVTNPILINLTPSIA